MLNWTETPAGSMATVAPGVVLELWKYDAGESWDYTARCRAYGLHVELGHGHKTLSNCDWQMVAQKALADHLLKGVRLVAGLLPAGSWG